MSIQSEEELEQLRAVGRIVRLALDAMTASVESDVPNLDLRNRARLHEGLVIAVEPIIAEGDGRSVLDRDGWTVRTADRGLTAHYEQTVVITKGMPLLITA